MSTPLSFGAQNSILPHKKSNAIRFLKKIIFAILFLSFTQICWAQDVDLELSLTANNATPNLFESIRLTYTLTNTGTAAANNIQVKTGICNPSVNAMDGFNQNNQIVNGSPGPSASVGSYSITNRRWTLPQLAAGTSATLEVSLFVLTTDEKTLLGEVQIVNEQDLDSTPGNLLTCTTSEDDEASFVINDDGITPVVPNIAVSDVSFGNSTTYRPGDDIDVMYNVTVEDADVPATMTRIYLFDREIGGMEQFVELGTVTTPARAANTTESFTQTFTIPTNADISDYRLIVKVDETNVVTESSEFDNQASPLSVQGVQPRVFINYPDLEITNVVCPSEYPRKDVVTTVNYQITLRNNGSQPTFATNLYHYQGEPDRNPFPLPILGQAAIPALAAGEEATISLSADLITEFPGYNSNGEVVYAGLFFSLNPLVTLIGEGYRLAEQDVFCQKYNTDIDLSLSADDLTYGLDEIIDYTITVTNNGSETAYNLFTDIESFLPIGTLENATTSANSEVYRFFNQTGTSTFHYYIPVLGVGESATADITFKIFQLDTPAQLTETVELTVYSGHLIDSDENNNTDALVFDFDNENNDCSVTATIENVRCGETQNGNLITIADVTVNGTGNISANGYSIPLEGGGSTSGNYGETRQLNLGADYVQDALAGQFAITVIDQNDPTCRVDVSEPAPDCTTGTDCTLTATIENMGSTQILGNTFITADVTVNATGTVSPNGYTLTVNGDNINSQTINYGQTIPIRILNTLVQNTLDCNFAFNVTDLDNPSCSMDFSEPVMNCGGNDDLIDLEIELTSDASLVWGNFRQFYVERRVRNLGPNDATDVVLTSSVQAGGNGSTSLISVGQDFWGRTLFDIDILDTETFYAQVQSVNEQDVDSTPGNGTCCTPNEDDEAVLTFAPCGLTATAELVDCIPGAGFGTDELVFNISVSGSTDNGWHAWRGEGGIFLDRPADGSFLHTIIRAELGTPTYIQDNINPLCEYRIDFPNITAACDNTGGGNVDLELSLSTTDPNPNLYTTVPMTYTLTNTSANTASDIRVFLSICNPEENRPRLFFNEYGIVNSSTPAEPSVGTYNNTTQTWSVSQLAGGESETITIYLFVLTDEPRTILGEILHIAETDVDSSPNLLTCTISEDDEASFTLNDDNTIPLPDFFLENSQIVERPLTSDPIQIGAGSTIDITSNFEVVAHAVTGTVPVLPSTFDFNVKVYLSTDEIPDANDIVLINLPRNLTFTSPPTSGLIEEGGLGGFTIPANTPDGNYFIITKYDADDEVAEADETNNTLSIAVTIASDNTCEITDAGVQWTCLLGGPGSEDDLVALEVEPVGLNLGSSYTVNGPNVNNQVSGYGGIFTLHGFSTSIDAVYTYTITDNDNPDCTIEFTFNPSSAGCSNSDGVDLELAVTASNPNPNIFTKTTLTYTLTNTGAEAANNSTVQVGMCSVQNGGFVNGFGFINANGVVYSSPSPNASIGSYNQTSQIWTVPQLAAGESATLDVTVFLLTGDERVVLGEVQSMGQADSDSTPGNLSTCTISEDDEARLALNGDQVELLPDLQLANLNSSATGEPSQVVSYTVDILNTGNAIASGDFEIGAYLSVDNQYQPTDVLMGGIGTGNAPVGTQADILGSVTVPLGAIAGDYFLILLIDKDGEITESNENNNTISIPFTVEDGACVCPDNYDPVCGSDGMTYGNACEAECAGIFNYTPGECGNSGEGCGFNEEYAALGRDHFLNLNRTIYTVNESSNGFNINYIGETTNGPIDERREVQLNIDQNGDLQNVMDNTIGIVHYTKNVTTDKDIELTKFDENGNEVWTRLIELDYPNITGLTLSNVFEVSNGLVMGGFLVDLTNSPQVRSAVIKTDLNGMNAQLTIIEDLPDTFFMSAVTEDAAGNLYPWWTTSGNYSLSMVDASGVSRWVVRVAGDTPSTNWKAVVPGANGDYVYALLTDNQKGFIRQINISTGEQDRLLNLGNIVNSTGGFTQSDVFGALALSNGDILISGTFNEPPNGIGGFGYTRMSSTGNVIWSQQIFDIGGLFPLSTTADGGYLFSTFPNNNNHRIIKTTSTGEILPECDGDVCVCPDNYDPVCGSDGVTYGNACEAECAGIFNYTPGECTIGNDGVDLEMELIAPANFNIYTNVIFQARVFNNGTVNAENVKVSFPVPDGFVHSSNSASHGAYDLFRERWNIGTLKAGETAILDLNLFALTSGSVTAYAQVSEANPTDVDSTPGNGTCCTPNEDDEAAVTISSAFQSGNGTTARRLQSANRDVEIKTLYPNIATNEVTIFVQSKLPELNMQVYNLQGQQVLQQKYQDTEGFQRLHLDVSELPTGTYLIRFDGTLGQQTLRFVKMRM